MLAVMKAGAAFVPLDPAHPAERLESLCASVKAKLILCGVNHMQMLSGVVDTVLAVDDAAVAECDADGGATLPIVSSSDVAYVIFTSGSTGMPKVTSSH
jgi:non-ribosomal peptide synthetase component F